MLENQVLLIWIDGLPYYKVELFKKFLGRDWYYNSLKPLLGFTDCFRVSLYTGCFPSKTGYWISLSFSGNSINIINKLWLLDYTPTIILHALRYVFTKIRACLFLLRVSIARLSIALL